MELDMDRPRMLCHITDCSMCRWYLILRQPSSLRESIFLCVHPYRTREVEVLDAQHALIGIDGRLMNTPVGSFQITVIQEVINFLIPV